MGTQPHNSEVDKQSLKMRRRRFAVVVLLRGFVTLKKITNSKQSEQSETIYTLLLLHAVNQVSDYLQAVLKHD